MDTQSLRIIAAARDVLKSHGYFVDNLWHIDDLQFLCEQSGYPRLSYDDAMTVFDLANARFDGEYGICWPQLEKALHAFMRPEEATTRQPIAEDA